MNKCSFTGRLTKDPAMRQTQSGTAVVNFSLAVDRPGTNKDNKVTDFLEFVVWGGKDGPGRAGVIEKYFHKGDAITITDATAQVRKWKDKDGNDRSSVEFVVRDFEFAMGKRGDGQTGQTKTAEPAQDSGAYTTVSNDDLPF